MDYSKWRNIADSDDEGDEGRSVDMKAIIALKEAADRTFETINSRHGRKEDYADCLHMYIRTIQQLDELSDPNLPELQELRGTSFMNMAAISMELSNWRQVMNYCAKASQYKRHYRCFYMQSVALDALGQSAESLAAINTAISIARADDALDELSEMSRLRSQLQLPLQTQQPAQSSAVMGSRGIAATSTDDIQQVVMQLQIVLDDPAVQPADKMKARKALSDCYEKAGDISKAISVLESAAAAETSDLGRVSWLYRAASLAYDQARDAETAFRLYRTVCEILGAIIDLYQMSAPNLRREFASTEEDRDRLLDDAIYELDSQGNIVPLGDAEWGGDSVRQEKYALLLACGLTSLGALHIKRGEVYDAVDSFKPAVCFLKHKLQANGQPLDSNTALPQPIENPPHELRYLQTALAGLSDGFAVLKQWDLASRAASQACVVFTILGRIDKRASMHASLGHIARNNNQPIQVVADNWWSAVRDYQKQGDARKAGDLLLLIGETYMKDANIEPFHITTTKPDSASSAYDAYTEAAKEIKRARLAGPRQPGATLTQLMLEEDARFNAGICCTDHKQGMLQLELALTLLNSIDEHPDSDKAHVRLRTADVQYHLAVRAFATRELENAGSVLEECILKYASLSQRSREKEAWILSALIKHQSGDAAGRDSAIQSACNLCVGPVEDPTTERERIVKMLESRQLSK